MRLSTCDCYVVTETYGKGSHFGVHFQIIAAQSALTIQLIPIIVHGMLTYVDVC